MSDLLTLEGFSLKKKLKKVAKAAAPLTKIAKTALPFAVTAMTAAVGFPVPPQLVKKGLNMATKAVKSTKGKKAILTAAVKKVGLQPGEEATPSIKQQISEVAKDLENKAISAAAQKIIKDEAEEKPEKETVKEKIPEKPEVKKAKQWTPEQIEEFNKSQDRGESIQASFKKAEQKESPGDQYYKKGLLSGEYEDTLKILATKIFSQNPYASVPLVSYKHVQNIIEAYTYSCLKLSEKMNKSMYYTGTSEAERQAFFGNTFIKIAYLYFKGYGTEEEAKSAGFDYVTRDQVWVTISLIKKYAEEDKTNAFMKFWKPFDFKSALPDAPVSMGKINPMIIAGGAALALFAFMS